MDKLKNLLLLLKAPSVLIALTVTLIVWMSVTAGVVNRPDGWLYDAFVRTPLITPFQQPDVFLVEYDQQDLDQLDWVSVVDALLSQGAAMVMFPTAPPATDSRLYDRARDDPAVVIGQSLKVDIYSGEIVDIEQPPEGYSLEFAIAVPQVSDDAVYRRIPRGVTVNGRQYPSIETVAAAHFLDRELIVSDDAYRVNFLHGGGYLPRIDAVDIVDGGLIPQLAKRRIALVGPSDFEFSRGLHTPISKRWNGLISDLEFRGFALNTLTQQSAIRAVPNVVSLLLMLLIAISSVLIYEYLRLRNAILLTGAVILAEATLSWVLLSVFQLWLPVVGLMVLQVALFASVFAYLEGIEEAALRRMVVETTVRIQERLTQSSFYASDEHWDQVLRLVTQVLHLERAIFLERVEGDHRVREIKAHRCEINDISEMRRDYERTPYSTALEAKGPLEIRRAYFTSVVDDEMQYLVPLVFAGEVLGFWAFTVMRDEFDKISGFETIARELGEQVAELLSHRKQWQLRVAREDNPLRQIFELDNQRTAYNALRRALNLLERRIDLSDSVAQNMHTGSVMFDPFGHIIYVNAPMENWARENGVALFEVDALGLISAVHDVEESAARTYLQHVMIEGGSLSLPITPGGTEQSMALMHITAVKHSQEWTQLSDIATPFELVGILFEIGDVTDVVRLFDRREELRSLFNRELRGEFDGLRNFVREKVETAGRRNIEEWIDLGARVEQVDAAVGDAERFTGSSYDSDHGYLPLDTNSVIHRAVQEMREDMRPRGLSVDYDPPEHIPLVMADELSLQQCLQSLISLLIEDAIEKTDLKIELEEIRDEQHDVSVIRMRDNGFGIPNERLQSYLGGVGGSESDPFEELRRVKDRLDLWGGKLSAESKIGMGLEFEIELPTYHPGDATADSLPAPKTDLDRPGDDHTEEGNDSRGDDSSNDDPNGDDQGGGGNDADDDLIPV